ncbi:PQQ-dependent sugar dehydrogenase [Cognatishimia activa]|uniref:PQQ-dependent sugar dehydrogenase n=1 Tax=Cognatishimia activa TaxID=1715691 RepID=UPI0022323DCE|nr:PQQ-dependent sugar dehydrogenase [Cognatishimia activa]UZD92169.1 PQQ-dependent sugar dehydrogenase [Cognatishimia activa]
MRVLLIGLFFMASTIGATAQTLQSSLGDLTLTRIASGFKTPWAIGFLPENQFLVTERRGRLYLVDPNGSKYRISGLPNVEAEGQGGLLDVLVPGDFAITQNIFMTFAKKQPRGSGTAVARARLDVNKRALTEVETIFEIAEGSSGGRHFGSRIAEGPDGSLYVTIGDRGDRPSAQNLATHNGSVLRIAKSGEAVDGNPFTGGTSAQAEIWSYGHRNPQGMAFDQSGRLWAVEHGARGGDEVNLVRRGKNYGWPVIAYGRHYSGGKIGEGTRKAGMEQPEHFWDPSIAPSGLMVYEDDLFDEWQGDIFIGSLKFDYISRLSGANLTEVEALKSAETKRVRDVRQAPDGTIWFISEDRGAIFQISR